MTVIADRKAWARAWSSALPAWLLAGAGLGRVLPWYLARLNDGTDEPYGLLPLAAALWFTWDGRRRPVTTAPAWLLPLLFCVTAAIYLLPLPPLLRALAALAVFAAVARIRHAAVLGLLALSLPVMASLQFYAGYPLRWLTAAGSEGILSACGVDCARTGTVITTPAGIVGVDAPCSGIRMLWTACVLALLFMSARRMGPWAVAAGLLITMLLVITGNILRAAILFFPESGAVHWPGWTHEATGAVLFALCTWALVKVLDLLRSGAVQPVRPRSIAPLLVRWLLPAAVLSATIFFATRPAPSVAGLPPQPGSFEGRALTPVPLSSRETAFASDFPGRLCVFAQEERQIIWRDVTQPTRSLHSSLDCLRAAGWSVREKPIFTDADGAQWGCAEAVRSGQTRQVRERITDASGRSWTDVSSWWWAATFGNTRGPWASVTVIGP